MSLALALLGYAVGRITRATPTVAYSGKSGAPARPRPAAPEITALAPGSTAASEQIAASLPPWEQRWKDASGQLSTPARDRELAALIEELAKQDPKKALAMAAAESNWRLREELRDAALKGWAATDAQSAGDWALTLRMDDRRQAVAAVLSGAANNPEEAVRVALRLCAADPEPAGDYGHSAIAALVKAGDFQAATNFGLQVGTDKFPFLIKSAFFEWAKQQPDRALAGLDKIKDSALRGEAYGEVIAGWAKVNAKAVAEYALKQPAGEARTQALAVALPHWVEKDPVAATEFMQSFDSGAEFDDGVAALANTQTLITRQPAKAMEWAATISDSKKRAEIMRTVFRQWAEKDQQAAQRYVQAAQDSSDRAVLEDELRGMRPLKDSSTH